MTDYTFTQDFKYTHKNPYHDKLKGFDDFVLRDQEAEQNKGRWNKDIFKREAPLCVEIGSGYGHFMIEFCQKNTDVNFVGLDYRFKRSFSLAKKLDKLENQNFRYLRAKGERIEFLFEENEVDNLFYFFPDPWPKNRHNKKRLIQTPFLESLYKVMKNNGKVYIKTDHDDYFEWMCEFIDKFDGLKVSYKTYDLWNDQKPHPLLSSFQTKFEKIFLAKGINIKAMVLEVQK